MAFFTIEEGLTIKIPTLNTTGWEKTLREECFVKISQHDHSGSGNGAPLGPGSFANDSVTDIKILLQNDGPLRALDNAGTTQVELLKLNTSDELEIMSHKTDTLTAKALRADNVINIVNNASAGTSTGIVSVDGKGYEVDYTLSRSGTEELREQGTVYVLETPTGFGLGHVTETFKDAGITFDCTVAGELTYESTDNADTANLMTYMIRRY